VPFQAPALKLKIFPGNMTGINSPEHAQVYDAWKNFWTKIYSDAGSLQSFVFDDFRRQDFVVSIFQNDIPVAYILHTLFDLEKTCDLDHRYFQFYPQEFLSYLKNEKIKIIQSFEFYTVERNKTQKSLGKPIADILLGCAMKVFLSSQAQAAIAPARKDVKVVELAGRWGWKSIIKDVVKRNFTCDLICVTPSQAHPHPRPQVNSVVEELWNTREVFGNTIQIQTQTPKAA